MENKTKKQNKAKQQQQKKPRDTIILQTCTKNYDDIMHCS